MIRSTGILKVVALMWLVGTAAMAQPVSTPSPSPLPPSALELIQNVTPVPRDNPEPDPAYVVVAIVNTRFLTQIQVERKVNALLKEERENKEIEDPAELEKFEMAFADRIINDWVDTVLLSEGALREGITVTAVEVQQRLAQIKEDSGLADDKLMALIRAVGLTPEEVRDEVRDIMLAERFIDVKSRPYMQEDNLKRIYEQIPKSFQDPPKVHLLHIVKTPRDPYNYNERQRLKKELEKIRKDIVKGADFAEMARRHSDGFLREYGGDMGWIGPENNLPAVVGKGAFTIGHMGFRLKPGQVSDVMETKYGFHIVKLVEKRPASGDTFDKAREAVKNFVRNETGRQLIKQLRESAEHKIIINAGGVPDRYTKNLNLRPPASVR